MPETAAPSGQSSQLLGDIISEDIQPFRSNHRTLFGRNLPFYGWGIAAVSMLIALSSAPGQSYVFSIFIDPIIESTGLSRTLVSTLYTIGTGFSAVMVAITSRLVDHFGSRIMLVVIGLALGLACMSMSLISGPIGLLFGFAALRALGQGSLPITATMLVAQWFSRYRGRAIAIMGLGFAASNAAFPALSRMLIETFDWRMAYIILGVLVWVLIIPATLLVVRNQPEDIGLRPDGEPPLSNGSESRRVSNEAIVDRRRIFSTASFWLLVAPLAASPFITTALVFHQVSIFNERGLDAGVAATVFVPFALSAALATGAAGWFIDRFGPKFVLVVNMGVLMPLSILVLWLINSPATALLYGLILGVSSGMHPVLSGSSLAYYYGRRGLGRIQGTATMIMIGASAVGPMPMAAIQGATNSYNVALVLLVGLAILAGVASLVFQPPEDAILPEPD